jgi:hypothetical protein
MQDLFYVFPLQGSNGSESNSRRRSIAFNDKTILDVLQLASWQLLLLLVHYTQVDVRQRWTDKQLIITCQT